MSNFALKPYKFMMFMFLMFLMGAGIYATPARSMANHHENTIKVEMVTDKGAIILELFAHQAPLTVQNFMQYVDSGFYDQHGSIYRVVRLDNDNGSPKIEVIQGGILDTDIENPFPAIEHEDTDATGIKHLDGTISMARGPVGSAQDAFFITIGDQPSLDKGGMRNTDGHGFAAFGRVVEGMDVVRAIQNIRDAEATDDAYVQGQILSEPVKIVEMKRWP